MASALKNLSNYDPNQVPKAIGKRIGIVVSDYHQDITFALLTACQKTLLEHGVAEEDITISHVPGAYELPLGAKYLYEKSAADAIICIGCVITGETKHDDYINVSVAQAIMQLNMQYNIPFVFGLLTPRNQEQAEARAGGKHGNKGTEVAVAALKMMALR